MRQLLFLQKDRAGLEEEIAYVTEQYKKATQDKSLATTQSSESWHDNFGYEEGVRQQNMLAKRLDELLEMKENASVIEMPQRTTVVGIGHTIILEDITTGKQITVIVGSYHVFKPLHAHEVSYEAPLVKPFFGAKKNTKREVVRGDTTTTFKIVSIT